MTAGRLIAQEFAGWNCKPVSDITGRLDQLADGSVLVLAWPDIPERLSNGVLPARLLYVQPTLISWDG